MLDDYKDNKFYDYAKSLKKYYHAYLFEVDSYEDNYPLILSFAKNMICKEHYTNNQNCGNCNICHLIDKNYYADLKLIEPDGQSIKKEQILTLQKELSLKSSNDFNQVYIIKEANKMNLSAANSLLKFIEEPEDGIIALLITDNIYKVLDTVVSRCQVINLNKSINECHDMMFNIADKLFNSDDKIQIFVGNEDNRTMVSHVIDFLVYLEKNKLDTILDINNLWNQFFSLKDDYLIAFEIMIMFYNDILNFKMNKNIMLIDYLSVIEQYDYFTIEDISNRLNLIFEIKNDLFSNVNLNLLMDKFIIRMEGI